MSNFLKLFANCVIVKGARRATICDLHRAIHIYIPNEFADILFAMQRQAYDLVLEMYNEEDKNSIKQNVDYIIQND